jgi:hypothetical protein
MFILDEKLFSGTMKVFQLPMSWFRSVSAFLNNFIGGPGLKLSKPMNPSPSDPVEMSLDEEFVKELAQDCFTAGSGVDITDGAISIDSDNLGEGTGATDTPTDASSGTAADESAQQSTPAYPTKDTTTWQAGVTGKPLSLFVLTRFYKPSGNYSSRFFLGRVLTFAPNGRLISMSAETMAYRV